MTARQSEKIFLDAEPSKKNTAPPSHPSPPMPSASPATTVRPGEQGTAEKRVLSVSPAREDRGPEQNAEQSREVFLSPRVIDEHAFNDLATTIRTMIDDATGVSDRLAGLLEKASDDNVWTNKASDHLQERLRLSARMLKAFQSQITRVEQTVASMDGQEQTLEASRQSLDESLEEFETHLCTTLEKFEGRMTEITDRAIARFDQHVVTREEDLNRVEHQTSEAVRRAEASVKIVEEAEQVILSLSGNAAESASKLDERVATVKEHIEHELASVKQVADSRIQEIVNTVADAENRFEKRTAEAKELIYLCDDASMKLATELQQTTENLDEAAARCRGIRCALEEKLDQSRHAEQMFQKRFEDITELVTSLEVDAKTYENLQTVLDRLEPWKHLVLRETGDEAGLPESLAQSIEALRDGIGRDMSGISKTMTDIARRIETSGVTGTLPSGTTELKPDSVGHAPDIITNLENTINVIKRNTPARPPARSQEGVKSD